MPTSARSVPPGKCDELVARLAGRSQDVELDGRGLIATVDVLPPDETSPPDGQLIRVLADQASLTKARGGPTGRAAPEIIYSSAPNTSTSASCIRYSPFSTWRSSVPVMRTYRASVVSRGNSGTANVVGWL